MVFRICRSGERTREGNDLLREMIESGVIRYGEAFKRKHREKGQLGPLRKWIIMR